MSRKYFFFLLFVFVTLSTLPLVCAAQEARNPAEVFRENTMNYLEQAKLVRRAYALADDYSSIDEWLRTGKSNAKKLFQDAHAQLENNSEESRLLKEYYAAWLIAFEGISPDETELKVDYERRQREALRRMNEAWHRFEIESNL